jgi:hypothetical protein
VGLIVSKWQTMSGPTYPVKGKLNVGGEEVVYELPRTHGGEGNEIIKLCVPDNEVEGKMKLKRYKSSDEWQVQHFTRTGDTLVAEIPHQAPAGKIEYQIFLRDESDVEYALTLNPVIIRFKGNVPVFYLILHILFIMASLVLSTRVGLEALAKGPKTTLWTFLTLIAFFLGGLVFGPIVQKYAFDAYWTGWPFGGDLTDNKTLLVFIVWLITYWRLKKNPGNRMLPIIATILMFIIFLIPHSVLGSEIDYTKAPIQ